MSVRRLALVMRHELAFNVRRPMFYICLAVVAFIVWGLSSGNVQIIIASGDASVGGKKAWLTSEFAAAQILIVTIAILVSFFVAAGAGMTVIRDDELRVRELLHATPLTAAEYDAALGRAGKVFNIVKAMCLNPLVLNRSMELYRAIMFGPSQLSRADRELLAVVVSTANDCHY